MKPPWFVRSQFMRRVIACKLAFSLFAVVAGIAFAPPLPAAAQDEDGQIVITVTDGTSKAPLAFARVLLEGPVMASELTLTNGKVIFTDTPPGVYTARIIKSGYNSITTSSFEVVSGQVVDVGIALAVQTGPKTIGTIVVKSQASISSTSISQDSPIRKLSTSLNDALNKLAGVSVGTDSASDDAPETISLEGHDPSQTQVLLDGIPLSGPGTASDLRLISSDLFGGASVSFNPVAGALGGSVNYRTLEPTRAWQFGMTQTFGNLGNAATLLSMQGTSGDIGIAYVHAIRGSDNQLDGLKYLDTSGFDYVHQGGNETGGDLLKLRANLGAQSLSGMFISSNGYNDALCTTQTGPIPCGYGPGNENYRHLSLESLSDTAFIGVTSVQLSLFGAQTNQTRDLLNQYVDGVYSPYGTNTTSSSRGATFSAELPARERHTISIQATTSSQDENSIALVPTEAFFGNAQGTSSYSTVSLTDSIRSNDKLTLGEHIGLADANNMGYSLLAGINGQWNPSQNDAVAGNLDFGNNGAGPPRFGVLSDPTQLTFNCETGTAYGSGPGDEPGSQTAFSARGTWQHDWPRIGDLSLSLYRQVQNDVLLNAQVNGTAFPPSYFPPGYFTEIGEIFQSAGGCGEPASAFLPSDLYLNVPISGVQEIYEGIQLQGDFNVSRTLAAEPFYTTQVVKPITDDPRLSNIYSSIISGSQLPGVPLHQAGVTFDYRAFNSPLEVLADARYNSPGNRQYLPGYVTADAGFGYDFTHGTISVSESNIFDKFGYEFASSSYAVGPATIGVGTLPVIARPLAPRTLQVSYTVQVGYGQTAMQAREWHTNPQQNQRQGGNGFFGPGGGGAGGRGPGAGGFFSSAQQGFPQTPPTDPFAPDTSRASCSGQTVAPATQTLDAVKAYVAAIEALKTAQGYPATLPPQMPSVTGFTIGYHPMQSTYALTFEPQTFDAMRGFLGCAPIHIGTKDEATTMHLYTPESSSFFRSPLAYMPAVGLYIVRQPPVAGQEQFRVYRLPTTPPAQPLAIVDSDRCTADLKPVAQQLLSSLSQYVAARSAGNTAPPAPAGWTVTPHTTAKGWWLELQPQAPIAIPALLNCARISAGSQQDLAATQLGGARLPSVNFAPALGLYIVRNAPPPDNQ
ncbi:MAG TPA: TonB-dependent receptor [Candidatus Acidoferrales bacterium]|nr:TonB-dependent receptor [Candidatus Acidoferrales bacterium]